MADLENIVAYMKGLQDRICADLEAFDGKARFEQELWERPGGGGGRTRVIREGNVFEKGGVNFSHVHGVMPDKISKRLNIPEGSRFHATGVSLVIHPRSPMVPISHANVRYFETEDGRYWFGGGMDVTPIYVREDQARDFHRDLKSVYDALDPGYYPRFKKQCDEYFFLKHRNETRGIGGSFFDFMQGETAEEKEAIFNLVKATGDNYTRLYKPFVMDNKDKPFSQREIDFQMMRRSRYVEFNLIYDKGTKFGLDTGGRTESILMSMPPRAEWAYNYHPEPGTPEARTMELLQPIDWLAEETVTQ